MTQTIEAAARRLQESMDRLERALARGARTSQPAPFDEDAIRDALSRVTRAEATVRRMIQDDGSG